MTQVIEVKEHPPEMSAAGRNAYYHSCGLTEQQRHFAACRHTIMAVERGDENILNDEICVKAIKHGNCPAQKMHQQELDAGKALYFEERIRPEPIYAEGEESSYKANKNSDSYKRGWNQVKGNKAKPYKVPVLKPVEKPKASVSKPKEKSIFDDTSMADVVNAAVSEEISSKEVESNEPAKPQARRLTMAERAKMMRESKGKK